MSHYRDFDNTDDVIDSRDVIAKIADLESQIEDIESEENPDQEQLDNLRDDLDQLIELANDASSSPDWNYGETLIRDSYFVDYARELADDIGAVDSRANWPNNCIDWDRAAEELQQDYTSVEFNGVTYWIRA